jgi:hypothetical protein
MKKVGQRWVSARVGGPTAKQGSCHDGNEIEAARIAWVRPASGDENQAAATDL